MTEAEWLVCTDPTLMLDVLGGKASERKLRLFVCACCRLCCCSRSLRMRWCMESRRCRKAGGFD